ncbi:hypothetical protein [Nocardia sp. NPDC056000]|uniref:hypothetical protein n=1 Tax=Nocardia sp. NPDC056000 TaxID=3345674 RepID=UPI0035DB539F
MIAIAVGSLQNDDPVCGSLTMHEGDTCVSGNSSRTLEEKKSSGRTLGYIFLVLGIATSVGGVIGTYSAAQHNAGVGQAGVGSTRTASAAERRRRPEFFAGQQRSRAQAQQDADADRIAGVRATVMDEGELPPPEQMWGRWAAIAAVLAAGGYEGIHVLSAAALGVELSSGSGGSTLHLLPGGGVVLSGGMASSPEMAAIQDESRPLPALYAGAPAEICDEVLDPRAARRELTFVYWWDPALARWCKGESAAVADYAWRVVPAFWDTPGAVKMLAAMECVRGQNATSIEVFVDAAVSRSVTREHLVAVLDPMTDLKAGMRALTLAGVAADSAATSSR